MIRWLQRKIMCEWRGWHPTWDLRAINIPPKHMEIYCAVCGKHLVVVLENPPQGSDAA